MQLGRVDKWLERTFVLPFLSSSISVESLACAMLAGALVAAAAAGGARGDANCAEVAGAGDAGDAADARMVDSGGGAGATNPAREAALSELVPAKLNLTS